MIYQPPDRSSLLAADDGGIDLAAELGRTQPDFVIYRPADMSGDAHDTGNEHLLVFDGPDGSLMVIWTQSTREGEADQHIMFSRSDDGGETWQKPMVLAGPPKPDQRMASWAFPLVSRSGRVYVIYSQHQGVYDTFFQAAGLMTGICSDDNGQSWSEPQTITMPRSMYDNPDPAIPAEWIVWQRPDRLTSDGRYLVGMTRSVSKMVRHPRPVDSWIASESVVEFLRFDNVDDDPDPGDLQIRFLTPDEKALRVGFPDHPQVSVVQEPSIVKLPDGRLFVTMRTSTGHPYWTQSRDDGRTWDESHVLLDKDGGTALLHPLSPCPIYDLGGAGAGSGDYVFFIHNNDGHFGQWGPTDTGYNRRPIYLLHGQFHIDAAQPVWFSKPKPFMDQGDIGLGPVMKPRHDLSLYASFTVRRGRAVLWYPDRKFFLLGRIIDPAALP
ncbi:MAG: exo-alpha-sialidase [Phycisphaeraceae bacterium]|nr:exo-alpha-sialidase [Phycisphaeraceae bacterium]